MNSVLSTTPLTSEVKEEILSIQVTLESRNTIMNKVAHDLVELSKKYRLLSSCRIKFPNSDDLVPVLYIEYGVVHLPHPEHSGQTYLLNIKQLEEDDLSRIVDHLTYSE